MFQVAILAGQQTKERNLHLHAIRKSSKGTCSPATCKKKRIAKPQRVLHINFFSQRTSRLRCKDEPESCSHQSFTQPRPTQLTDTPTGRCAHMYPNRRMDDRCAQACLHSYSPNPSGIQSQLQGQSWPFSIGQEVHLQVYTLLGPALDLIFQQY